MSHRSSSWLPPAHRIYRLKTDDFKYFVRLEGLLPAYVATVVEVVRRREFGASRSVASEA